jgi:hypothetical protein
MKKIKVGLRFSEIDGVSFFGLDEVNESIKQGKEVISIEEGGAIMEKLESDEESIQLTLKGFSMFIIIED